MMLATLDADTTDETRRLLMNTTATDEDEITEPAGSNRSRNDAEEREIRVKWQMPGNNDQTTTKKQLQHLLANLLIVFPNRITFIDRKQREWSYNETHESEKFEKEMEQGAIQLHPVKNKQQQIIRWVSVTTLRSAVDIQEWKNNDQFHTAITEAKTYLFPHPFATHEWDIISIGFLKQVHTIHYPKEEAHKHITQMLEREVSETKTPTFQLVPQRVSTSDKKASTKAYVVQCVKSEAKQLSQLLTHGEFRTGANQMFVPFKYKTTKPELFLQCIRQQNDVYFKTWVIKVKGFSINAMEVIKPEIIKLKGIFDIVPTKRINDTGEWKILVDQTKCAYLHRTLTATWPNIIAKIPKDILDSSPVNFSTPEISSRKMREYQHSDSESDSYGSLLTTGTEMSHFTLEETYLNELPTVYQYPSYAAAATASTTSLASTQISSPTASTSYNEWQREKQELEAQIQKQAQLIEKIQIDLQDKISRSHDLEEQLAQAIELAYSRDARHEEILEKFEMLLQQQDKKVRPTKGNQSPPIDRHQQEPEPPPSKKANTNSSPHRNIYAMFQQPTIRQAQGKTSQTEQQLISRRSYTASVQHMETDEVSSPPRPGVKSGKKLE